ncbi:MAG: hypothetical protein AB8B91_08520 [Rubripirellula sp.]
MAVRLPVVFVHATPPSASAQRKADEIVGELIGRAGIDLTLVGPLAGLSEQTTDRLTLDALVGDVAVLDWQTPEQIHESLNGIEFDGRRARHRDDPGAPEPNVEVKSRRRIYAFDMNAVPSAAHAIESLEKLKADQQVRTFSLDALAPKPSDGAAKRVALPIAKQTQESAKNGFGTTTPSNHQESAPHLKNSDSPSKVAPTGEQALDLDDLLDQLDDLDP